MVGRKLAGRGLLSRILLYIRHEPAVPAAASLLIALATVAWAGAATDLALYWGGTAVRHWQSVAVVAVAATAWHAALLAMGGPSVFRNCLVFAASASAPVAVYFDSLLGAFLPTLWMAMLAAALPLAALLVSFPRYGRLLECVARYVGETVPAPDSTAGRRWVATACPGGEEPAKGRKRALRRLGRAARDARRLPAERGRHVRLPELQGGRGRRALWEDPSLERFDFYRVDGYNAADDVASVGFRSLDELERLLESELLLDASYRLNVELMRKGNVLQARYANAPFMDEVLAVIAREEQG